MGRKSIHVQGDLRRPLEPTLITGSIIGCWSHIFEVMLAQMEQIVETICEGDFLRKNSNEVIQFLDCMEDISNSWEDPRLRMIS